MYLSTDTFIYLICTYAYIHTYKQINTYIHIACQNRKHRTGGKQKERIKSLNDEKKSLLKNKFNILNEIHVHFVINKLIQMSQSRDI